MKLTLARPRSRFAVSKVHYAVTVRYLSGETVSFFADRGLVKEGRQPLLRVRFLGPTDQPQAGIVVMLPGSAMDAERRYLHVREDDVIASINTSFDH